MVYFNNATFTMAQIQSDASLNYKSGSEVLNRENFFSFTKGKQPWICNNSNITLKDGLILNTTIIFYYLTL